VRAAALGTGIVGLAPSLGKQRTIELLLPLLLQLLKDDNSEVCLSVCLCVSADAGQVRLNVITNLEAVSRVIGIELLAHRYAERERERERVNPCFCVRERCTVDHSLFPDTMQPAARHHGARGG
jgi:hypothetical protein